MKPSATPRPSAPSSSSSRIRPPPVKRRRQEDGGVRNRVMTLDSALSDELFIRVMLYLEPRDLARLQSVSRRLCVLAQDAQIWKRLFIQTFVSHEASVGNARSKRRIPTLSDLKTLLSDVDKRRADGNASQRTIRGLPKRYLNHASHDEVLDDGLLLHDGIDWQGLYRVSLNWERGSYTISELLNGLAKRASVDEELRTEQMRPSPENRASQNAGSTESGPCRTKTLVQTAGDLIFTASRTSDDAQSGASGLPHINVYLEPRSQTSSTRRWSETAPHEPMDHQPIRIIESEGLASYYQGGTHSVTITELKVACNALNPDTIHLFAAYSTGDLSIFVIQRCKEEPVESGTRLRVDERVFQCAASRSPIVMSSIQLPLLVTCTADFCITIYRVGRGVDSIHLLRKMKSFTCHWPASMSLRSLGRHEDGASTVSANSMGKRKRSASPSPSRPRQTFSDLKAKRARRGEGEQQPSSGDAQDDDDNQEFPYTFRLDIAYCTPSYPNNWTVSLQEVQIRCSAQGAEVSSRYATATPRQKSLTTPRRGHTTRSSTPTDSDGDGDDHEGANTAAATTAPTAPSTPHSIFDGDAQSHQRLPAVPASKRIISISYDEPFLVAGSSDNMLDVYEVENSIAEASNHAHLPPLKVHHRRVLHGHMGSVLSVAQEDGRCVSGSNDGTVMVWTLGERQWQAMHHVVTLKPRHSDASSDGDRMLVPTLRDLLEQVRREHASVSSADLPAPSVRQVQTAIKWVSTSFDRVLSVSSNRMARDVIDRHGREQDERVQVWSFAG